MSYLFRVVAGLLEYLVVMVASPEDSVIDGILERYLKGILACMLPAMWQMHIERKMYGRTDEWL